MRANNNGVSLLTRIIIYLVLVDSVCVVIIIILLRTLLLCILFFFFLSLVLRFVLVLSYNRSRCLRVGVVKRGGAYVRVISSNRIENVKR